MIDDFYLSPDDEAQLAFDQTQYHRETRWKALAALWGRPIVNQARTSRRRDGIVAYERNRDEEWSLWRGILATIAIVADRGFSERARDRALARWRADRSRPYPSRTTVAFFDSRDTYGGYDVMVVDLLPGCRVSIFSDGECLM